MEPRPGVPEGDSHAETRGAAAVIVGFIASLIAVVGLQVRSRRLRSARTITTRSRADGEALKANEIALQQLLEGLPCQIAAAEPDGRHSYANRRMLDYCGMTLEEAKDSGWLGIIHPEDRPGVAAEKGLGVGLSICRSIVQAHAGRLWATADEGGGSTFEFTLPVHEPANP